MQSPQQRLHSTVILSGKRYRITREGGNLAFGLEMNPEPPFEQGLPPLVSEGQFTWHLGGFKSRQGIVGTSEYGVNTDTRWPYNLIPSPQKQSVTLPPLGDNTFAHFVFSAGGFFWVCAGNSIYRIARDGELLNPTPLAQPSAAFPSTLVMGLEWEGVPVVTTTDETMYIATPDGSLEPDMRPTGTGNSAQWTPSAGANWENVDELVSDGDATYNESSTANQKDTFNFTNSAGSFGASAPRLSIGLLMRRTSLTGANPVVRVVVRLAGVESQSPDLIVTSTSYLTYGAVFSADPSGNAWTDANIDAAEIGYILITAPGAGTVRVTVVAASLIWDTWTLASGVSAEYLARGPSRLFKVADTNPIGVTTLKNIAPGIAFNAEASWGDEVTIPGTLTFFLPTGLENFPRVSLSAFQQTAIVCNQLGVWGVSEEGLGVPIVERIVKPVATMSNIEPWLYLPNEISVLRWVPGLVESIGLEHETTFDVPFTLKPFQSIVAHGKYFYAVSNDFDNSIMRILVGRERQSNEPGLGPFIWDTFGDDEGTHVPAFLSLGQDSPEFGGADHTYLFFPRGIDGLGYYILPHTAGHPEIFASDYRFNLSGTRYSVKYRFGTWDEKSFSKIDVVGHSLNANVYWEVAFSIDGGAYQTTDINGSVMRKNTNGKSTFTLPLSAVGREIQFRFTYTSNSNTARGTIEYWEVYALPQAQRQVIMVLGLTLEAHQMYEDGGRDERTAAQQLADLQSLVESGVITAYGPWEEWYNSTNVLVRSLRILTAKQSGSGEPVFGVELGLEIREVE